jgi:hypothetical protein
MLNQKKVRTQKAKPIDRAAPVIRKPKRTDSEKVTVTHAITTAMMAAPQWNASPELQAANKAWNTAADAVENTAKSIADTRTKLATLEATQRANRHDWNAATSHMITTAAVVCQGSPDTVHVLGFDVRTHVAPIAQVVAPGGLAWLPGTAAGEAIVTWQKGTARHGFTVQRATDPANPATYSGLIPCTKTKYKIAGEKSSTVVHVRVAAIDPTVSSGLGPWSDWVGATVR